MTLRPRSLKRFFVDISSAVVAFLLSLVLGVFISPIKFHLEGMGRGKLWDGGGYFGIQSYTSTYFIKLSFFSGQYPSPEKANEAFAETVMSAVKIIDLGHKYNRHGNKVGERAVAILLDPESNEQYASVFWTDGRILCSVDSSSLTHVLQFEKYRNDERE
jgi:hypothetical protein